MKQQILTFARFIFKAIFLTLVFISTSSFLGRDNTKSFIPDKVLSPIERADTLWADSMMNTLSMKEKVAQLFMLAVYSNKSEKYNQETLNFVKENQLGGVIFMQGSPYRQVVLNNQLQAISNIPLMIGFDGEWGLSMRLDSSIVFPKAMTLGAIQNDQLLFDMGEEIGRQCRRMGIHINFAPVLDVNSNPKNPIINYRSFGEDKNNVARKGLAYAMGLQSQQVLAVGKHFPGHGDTKSDSHHTLPIIHHDSERLKQMELFPFKTLFNNGLGGVMVAHMEMPNVIREKGLPSSLSHEIVTDLLKSDMHFNGLVFTDALNMKGVTRDFEPGEIEIKALQAGNDVLLFSADIKKAIEKVNEAVNQGRISEDLINERCYKILKTKAWLGITQPIHVNENNLYDELHTNDAYELKEELIENSITVCNGENVFPIRNLEDKRIASVILQKNEGFRWNESLNLYAKVDTFRLDLESVKKNMAQLLDSLKSYDLVMISLFQTSSSSYRNYGIDKELMQIAEQIGALKGAVMVLFVNPYALASFNKLSADMPYVVAYENASEYQYIAAQSLFGGRAFNGKLPVSSGSLLKTGMGDVFSSPIRLSYVGDSPLSNNNYLFSKIDSMAIRAVGIGATPGCQIMYVKEGKVLYNKTFGYHTYHKNRSVKGSDLYDIASVTKIASSTLSLMKLSDDKKIEPSDKLSKHLEQFKKTDKKNLRINEFLSHQSGFHSWIPFYRKTLDDKKQLRRDLYKNEAEGDFTIQVLENLYLRNDYRDTVFQAILDTPIYKQKKYRYSDLGYYFVPELVERKAGMTLDRFVQEVYYKKMGMHRTTYRPLTGFSYPEIVPSESDQQYRHSIIHGFVNDQGAAMLGGVSGHAGLFSNANDLAKMGQMLLNGGEYGGDKYLTEKTIAKFNKSYYTRKGNRRGLGFDKPALKKGDPGPSCESASRDSYGHSGFTGAYIWIDPANQSVFVFLSNRTYPDPENKKLVHQNIRTDIHQQFYDAFQH